MGGSVSKVGDEMGHIAALWESREVKGSQTELFRKFVPDEPIDFTENFNEGKLGYVFTSDKIVLNMMGNYNSNHLHRDTSSGNTCMPVYSDAEFTVLHPLGQPGLGLGEGHGSKGSHLMVVSHSREGPILFNPMIPTTHLENLSFENSLGALETAVNHLKNNIPLSQCGQKVVSKATSMGVDHQVGIREFLIKMITELPEDIRDGRPGYKLFNMSNVDIAKDKNKVTDMINAVYTNETLTLRKLVQPPGHNSQLLSHIHGFLVTDVPECMNNTYMDCEEILKIKKEHVPEPGPVPEPEPEPEPELELEIDVSEEEDDDCSLTRTFTNASRLS
jgi:hypothetical protein